MSRLSFPEQRDDGSVSVAVRLVVLHPETVGSAVSKVASWFDQAKARGLDASALRVEPYVVAHEEKLIDVVLEGRPVSRYWKDWMVALVRDLASPSGGFALDCFYDLVGEAPHPASRSLAERLRRQLVP